MDTNGVTDMTVSEADAGVAPDQLDSLATVLDLIRSGAARTRPELGQRSGLGRTVITLRLAQLINFGLVEEGGLGRSTGGRAPRKLRFRAEAGVVLAAEFGATSLSVGVTDLTGRVIEHREEPWDIATGPEPSLARVEELLDALLADREGSDPPVWGVGVGLPGPVEFASGRPVAPPTMPGWDGYPVRDRLAARYNVPVWVDNEVNLMALGEFRGGLGRGVADLIYIKIGSGIGAGLISGGRLHRGAQGCAGDVGHVAVLDDTTIVCRCGKIGCLEAVVGGAALAREAAAAAADGRSPFLAEAALDGHRLEARDVARAAEFGDPIGVDLLTRTGRLVGRTLATLVNFFNPSMIIVGGGVASAGDVLLAAIREAVYQRSLPLATRNLQIAFSPLGVQAGMMGAAFMVSDELFSRQLLGHWISRGKPLGLPELVG